MLTSGAILLYTTVLQLTKSCLILFFTSFSRWTCMSIAFLCCRVPFCSNKLQAHFYIKEKTPCAEWKVISKPSFAITPIGHCTGANCLWYVPSDYPKGSFRTILQLGFHFQVSCIPNCFCDVIFHTKRLFAVSFSFSLRHLLNGAGISDRTDIGAFHDMWHYSTESSVYPSLVYHDSHHIFIQFDRYVCV